ncbi:hypothetical protein BDV39DRAFT_210880 [Aspergillus sergii]|uniref:Uncharacterized protein n=1 Tax=Aspergillus sergii TaxID=1034303 RepID=A0A5N6WNB2_9EURO|nr:hypothetical protein BDV39DRAFT_210880 [Aspergillus sergii]
MAPRSLTAKDLVTERIEDLRVSKYHTDSDSTHDLYFVSDLGYWGNFERNAREYFQFARFSNKILDYAPEKEDDHEFHVRKEQLLCGDEHSVVARFGQNIGHVMTSVLRGGMGTKVRFGDYKCVKPDVTFNKVPDIAVMDDSYDVVLVGEAKTPWKHDIIENEPKNIVFRKYLGQIAGYMYDTNSKYGFLTTYDQTTFFKQEPHPKKNGNSADDIPKKEDYVSEGSSIDLILKTLTLTLTLKAHHPLSVIFKTLGIHRFNLRLSLSLNLLAVVKTFDIRRFNLSLSLLAVVKTFDLRLSLRLNLRVVLKMLSTEVPHGQIGCSTSVSVRQHGVIVLQLAEEGTDVATE